MAFDVNHIVSILKRYKFFVAGAVAFIFVIIVALSFSNQSIKTSSDNKSYAFNVQAMGGLSDLTKAMKDKSRLRVIIKQLLDIDEAALFSNYKAVDGLVTEALFIWIGQPQSFIKNNKRETLVENFLRNYYDLPGDMPLRNNPILEKHPWYDLLQSYKAKILMQGHGRKVFEGVAYYDNIADKMVIEGNLSFGYIDGLADFIQTQDSATHRGFINSYLFFVDNTLGLKNLNKKERTKLKEVGFIK